MRAEEIEDGVDEEWTEVFDDEDSAPCDLEAWGRSCQYHLVLILQDEGRYPDL